MKQGNATNGAKTRPGSPEVYLRASTSWSQLVVQIADSREFGIQEYRVTVSDCADVEEDHTSFFALGLILEEDGVVSTTVWTLDDCVGQSWFMTKVCSDACSFPRIRQQIVPVDGTLSRFFFSMARSAPQDHSSTKHVGFREQDVVAFGTELQCGHSVVQYEERRGLQGR